MLSQTQKRLTTPAVTTSSVPARHRSFPTGPPPLPSPPARPHGSGSRRPAARLPMRTALTFLLGLLAGLLAPVSLPPAAQRLVAALRRTRPNVDVFAGRGRCCSVQSCRAGRGPLAASGKPGTRTRRHLPYDVHAGWPPASSAPLLPAACPPLQARPSPLPTQCLNSSKPTTAAQGWHTSRLQAPGTTACAALRCGCRLLPPAAAHARAQVRQRQRAAPAALWHGRRTAHTTRLAPGRTSQAMVDYIKPDQTSLA